MPAGPEDVPQRLAPVADRNRHEHDVDVGAVLDLGVCLGATTRALEPPSPRQVFVAEPNDRRTGEVSEDRQVVELHHAPCSEDSDPELAPAAAHEPASRVATTPIRLPR